MNGGRPIKKKPFGRWGRGVDVLTKNDDAWWWWWWFFVYFKKMGSTLEDHYLKTMVCFECFERGNET